AMKTSRCVGRKRTDRFLVPGRGPTRQERRTKLKADRRWHREQLLLVDAEIRRKVSRGVGRRGGRVARQVLQQAFDSAFHVDLTKQFLLDGCVDGQRKRENVAQGPEHYLTAQ